MSQHFIIGCGGIGGWVVPLLLKMKPASDRIILMDGDRVEAKNFDRQLFQPEHLGWNKAEALGATYGLTDIHPRYLEKATRPAIEPEDWIWCCVDNHPARLECLNWVDNLYENLERVNLLIGGNEYEYQEAYLYRGNWKNAGVLDPRLKYPEILTDTTGDPARPSCTGLAQKENPQLALFNYLAAGSMVHLWLFQIKWAMETDAELWPIGHSANRAIMQSWKWMDTIKVIEPNE